MSGVDGYAWSELGKAKTTWPSHWQDKQQMFLIKI